MKIHGPYIHTTGKAKGRRYLNIINDNGSKTTVMYARYLMEQHLGRKLLPSETVDHIDNDKTNDAILNLQILTSSANAKKHHASIGTRITWLDLLCEYCGISFKRNARYERHNKKLGKIGTFCGHSCSGKATGYQSK
jgi:hypothetical protein